MADGHLNSCKACKKAYQRGHPYPREYERHRNQTEKRKEYHAANLKRWRRRSRKGVRATRATAGQKAQRARRFHGRGVPRTLREIRQQVPPVWG